MLRIGVTAGIGSGKSTVCKYFEEELLVPVYYMDVRSKELANEKTQLRVDLSEHFGPETFIDGVYNTKHIADIIFENPEERKWMEHKIGEYMKEDYAAWLKANKDAVYIMVESAIFFEAKCSDMVDYIVGVECPYAIRLERVQKRNNFTTEQVTQRMKNQMNEDEKMALCDFHVFNGDISLDELHNCCLDLNSIFRKMGKKVHGYRKLIAQAVGYGVGVGQEINPWGAEPDKKFMMDTVDSFFTKFAVE